MTRPLGFPSGGSRLLKLLLGVFLLPVLLIAGVSVWLSRSLTPLQLFYLNVYAASTIGETQPQAVTQIRWVMKTAPGLRSLPMMPSDAVRGRRVSCVLGSPPKPFQTVGVALH